MTRSKVAMRFSVRPGFNQVIGRSGISEAYYGRYKMATGKRTPRKPLPASRKADGTQLKRLRRPCLPIPGAMGKIPPGGPTVFAPKRVFPMFANNHHNDGPIAVWLPAGPGVQ